MRHPFTTTTRDKAPARDKDLGDDGCSRILKIYNRQVIGAHHSELMFRTRVEMNQRIAARYKPFQCENFNS
jgi:hypothetical protein